MSAIAYVFPLVQTVACVVFLFGFVFITYLVMTNKKKPTIVRFEQEKYFKDPSGDRLINVPFPTLSEPPACDLSVIIPAYNEEERLPKMLDECIAHLTKKVGKNPSFSYEIIVVDDGSRDRTTEVAMSYVKEHTVKIMRVLTLVKNRGKGGAVRLGMLSSRGRQLLLADADGATKFEDFDKLQTALLQLCETSDHSLVIGSRAHLEKESVAKRSLFRTFLMYGFHSLVWFFGVRNVRDTQCGFKLFTREAADVLFNSLHVERWAFDVELLYIAQRLDMQIQEVAVNWTEIEGSKLVPFWSWLQMGIDLLIIWLKYFTGLWVIDYQLKKSG